MRTDESRTAAELPRTGTAGGSIDERVSRRRSRTVHRSRILEPNSVNDARARVEARVGVFPRRGRLRRTLIGVPLAMVGADVAALAAQLLIIGHAAAHAVLFAVVMLGSRAAAHQYRSRLSLTVLDDLPRTVGSSLAAVGVMIGVTEITGYGRDGGALLLQRAALFVAFAVALQAVVVIVAQHSRRTTARGRRTLVVGSGPVASTLIEALCEHPELGLQPVLVADPAARSQHQRDVALPTVAVDMSRLARAIVDNEIDTTILALDDGDAHIDTVIAIHQTGCEILLVPPMFEMHHDGPGVERVRGIPMIRLRPDPTLRLSWWIKRSVDVLAGALGLLVLALPLAIVALAILIESGRPILFWQERVGLDGRIFRLCKFRSMSPRSETESQTQWNIASDPRVSRIGHLIRRSSVDEIPQLWNIVRGHMSLVGPRPERPGFVEKFTLEHERYWARHRVPVGLTGLAQVNGLRGDTSIRERARYDNYYIANWSLWLDLKIVLLTAREVVGGRGR